jgi:hypothetical protein
MPTSAILAGAGGVANVVGGLVSSKNTGSEEMRQAALPMPQEIKALEDSIKQQEYVINRERELIKQVDPALLEAGKQAYEMMKGKESEVMGPIKRNRERQKQVLKETLRRQLGPGFETSSAGIEALSRFDAETNDHLAINQQQMIGQLLGTAQNAAAMGRGNEQNAIQGLQHAAQGFGNIAARRMNAASVAGQMDSRKGNIFSAIGSGLQGASSVFGAIQAQENFDKSLDVMKGQQGFGGVANAGDQYLSSYAKKMPGEPSSSSVFGLNMNMPKRTFSV